MDLEKVDPVELAEALSKLPPTHQLVAAARAAVDVSDARWDRDHAMAEASRDVASGWSADGGATDAQRMWAGRAEVDGPDSRAAEKSAELSRPPTRDEPAQRTYNAGEQSTADAVRWARQWAADRAADDADADRAADEARARHTNHHTEDEHVRELTDVR